MNKDGQLVLFHFNPRFDEHVIVRNYAIKGKFDYYKGDRDGGFPLRANETVDFRFFIAKSGYHIYINDDEFGVFEHKLPKSIWAKHICVYGSLLNVLVSSNEGK